MATIERFEQVISWQEASVLNKHAGRLIDSGRFKKSYPLINQIEGSEGSIMDNIAEGFERGGNKEFVQFLYLSKGSFGEWRSPLFRALDINYINQKEFDELSVHAMKISSLIQKLITYLENSEKKGINYKPKSPKTS